jgi:hypothetical protein
VHRCACLRLRPCLAVHCLCFTQPALLVLGRRRPARLLATRRLLGFGQQQLLVTCPSVLLADLVLESRLHRRVPVSVVRAFVACALFALVFSTRLFARRPRPVRRSTIDSINLLRYEAMPRLDVQWLTTTGPCAAGYFCDSGSTNATTARCELGSYCPSGTPSPVLCPAGRFTAAPCLAGLASLHCRPRCSGFDLRRPVRRQ